jgi:DMSO reductase anchor subunit
MSKYLSISLSGVLSVCALGGAMFVALGIVLPLTKNGEGENDMLGLLGLIALAVSVGALHVGQCIKATRT